MTVIMGWCRFYSSQSQSECSIDQLNLRIIRKKSTESASSQLWNNLDYVFEENEINKIHLLSLRVVEHVGTAELLLVEVASCRIRLVETILVVVHAL